MSAVNVETDRRGFVPVNERMEVLDTAGKPVPHLYCIGDANGKPPPRIMFSFKGLQYLDLLSQLRIALQNQPSFVSGEMPSDDIIYICALKNLWS